MLVSFTLPTRKRIPQLTKALESIYSTCYSKDNFEILLAIDNDDLETIEFVKNFITNHHNTKMFLFERQRYKGMHIYQNTLISNAFYPNGLTLYAKILSMTELIELCILGNLYLVLGFFFSF